MCLIGVIDLTYLWGVVLQLFKFTQAKNQQSFDLLRILFSFIAVLYAGTEVCSEIVLTFHLFVLH